jgi:putative transposase
MQTRLDAPGTWHHVIVRGIEKRPASRGIDDRADRDNFVSRLGQIALYSPESFEGKVGKEHI